LLKKYRAAEANSEIINRIKELEGNKMAATNLWQFKKWFYAAVCLVIVPWIFTIAFGSGCAKEPEEIVAPQEAQVNQAAVEARQEQKESGEKEPLRFEHEHPAFAERVEERQRMVARQIQARNVRDPNVLKAMRTVPRHAFIRFMEQRHAYADSPLPIGFEQTISQPYIVAFMTEALQLKPNSKVLEIGTGSGYQAAVCAEIAEKVYTIEIVEGLAKRAKKDLKELGYSNVITRFGDGYFGWKEEAPFDAIIGTAAAGRIPEPLLEQIKPGGRMILPYGSPRGFQYLVVVTKDKEGKIRKQNVMPVRFVPMTGEVMKPEKVEEK
jgi:protein-L-isoaspartate(D-aspartate) O-methyltransferase